MVLSALTLILTMCSTMRATTLHKLAQKKPILSKIHKNIEITAETVAGDKKCVNLKVKTLTQGWSAKKKIWFTESTQIPYVMIMIESLQELAKSEPLKLKVKKIKLNAINLRCIPISGSTSNKPAGKIRMLHMVQI